MKTLSKHWMEVSSEVVCFGTLFTAVAADKKQKRWREFLSDPSQWWDHRSEKVVNMTAAVTILLTKD